MYARSIKFTASANQEILDLPAVKEVLYDMLGASSEEEYNALRANGINTNVDVFSKDVRIKINNTTWNDLIENAVYSTNNISKIYSVKANASITGVIAFTMEDK